MTVLEASLLTPRDRNSLNVLKGYGMSLVELRISQVSIARGQLLQSVRIPENTRLLCVVREGELLMDLEALFLQEGDALYLLTDDETAVRTVFTI